MLAHLNCKLGTLTNLMVIMKHAIYLLPIMLSCSLLDWSCLARTGLFDLAMGICPSPSIPKMALAGRLDWVVKPSAL